MCLFRRQLRRVAGAWLITQLCVLTLTSAVISAAALGPAVECTCTHGDAHTCPMHHPAPKSPSSCSCRSTADGPGAVIAALLGPIAIIPAALAPAAVPLRSERLHVSAVPPLDALSIPDGPPPRT
jgi:hypothetical protein